MQDALEHYLTKNASLTHLLLRHVRSWGSALRPELARVSALANASESLRWIGFEVDGALRCWEIKRARILGESTDHITQETVLVEMHEDAGRGVLAVEQMDEFRQ